MKQFEFNGKTYTELGSLLEDFIANYSEAQDYIIKKYKKFLKFVKSLKNDKQTMENLKDYYIYSKSKTSLLTFVIFELLDEKKVYINGNSFTFEEFCLTLKQVDIKKRNALVDFLKDGGIQYTYSRMPEYEYLKEDAKNLDATGDSEETINYLINYFEPLDESYAGLLQSIFTSDEKYRKFNRLLKEKDFITYLSHKYGFTGISKSFTASSKAFEVAKVLVRSGEYNINDILSIFENTYFLWLPENYKNYKFKKKEAGFLQDLIKKSRKQLKKFTKKNMSRLINKVSKKSDETYFDKLMDLYSTLNDNYVIFCKLAKDGLILSKGDYKLDYEYANVLVCQKYASGKNLTLANDTPNPSILDDTSLDFSDFSDVKNPRFVEAQVFRARVIQGKNSTLSLFCGVTVTIFAFITIAAAIFLLFVGEIKQVAELFTKTKFEFADVARFVIYAGVALVFGIAFAIALSSRASITEGYLSDLLFLKRAEAHETTLTVLQKTKYTKLKKKEHELENQLRNGHGLLSSATILMHSIAVATFATLAMFVLSYMKNMPMDFHAATGFMLLLGVLGGPALTTIVLYFKRPKNNWLLILFDLVTIGIVFAVNQFLAA